MTEEDRWTSADVAKLLGVKPSTVYGYVWRGLLPEPDGAVGRVRWWYASTILDWHKNRPGKAWRKGLGA